MFPFDQLPFASNGIDSEDVLQNVHGDHEGEDARDGQYSDEGE